MTLVYGCRECNKRIMAIDLEVIEYESCFSFGIYVAGGNGFCR